MEAEFFKDFFMCVLLNLKRIKFYFINKPQISTDNQAFYWVKDPQYDRKKF